MSGTNGIDEAPLRVFVLGPVAVADGRATTPLRGQQASILALLAAEAPRPIPVDVLIDELWPTGPPASARTGLGVVIHRIRQRLGGRDTIANDGESYRLALDPSSVDLLVFVDLLAAAAGSEPERRLDLLETALALWRGTPFLGVEDSPRLRPSARSLEELRLGAQEDLADALLAVDRPLDAAAWATRLVEQDPYRERRHELLTIALYRCGRQAEALRAVRSAQALLRTEFGIEAGPTLAGLERAVLEQSPSLDAEADGPTDDGGAYLAAGHPPAGPPPAPASPFVGRESIEDDLADLVERERLVTLIGPMGVGKSRLALRLARSWAAPAPWIDLRSARGDELADRLAAAVGVRSGGDLGAIADELGGRRALVVLDNADPVADDDRTAAVVEELLSRTPDLRVVVTSRRPLAAPSERLLAVPPLDRDTALGLLGALASVPLAEGSGFAPDELGDLVERLDRLPLCIELVAPALATTPVDRICADFDRVLGDARRSGTDDERHRSLDAALSWTLRRLSPGALALFADVSVFQRDFSVAGAAAVTERDGRGVVAAIDELRANRLVAAESSTAGTFRLLNSARIAASGRLDERRRRELARRHARYHAAEVVGLEPQLVGADEAIAVARLRSLEPELVSTFRGLLADDDAELLVRFAATLWEHDFLRQRHERYGWLEATLAHPGVELLDDHAEVLGGAALAAWASDRFDTALRLAERAERVAVDRGAPQPLGAIKARFNIGVHRGDLAASASLLERLLVESAQRSDPRHHSDTLVIVALGQTQLGLPAEARSTAERALELVAESGNPTSISWARCGLGAALLPVDEREAARTYNAAARLAHSVSSTFVEAMALTGLATALRRLGRRGQAQAALLEAIGLWARSRATPQVHRCGAEAALVLLDRGDDASAARILSLLDLADRHHPLLPDDQARIDEAVGSLDLDQPIEVGPGGLDTARAIVAAVRSSFDDPEQPTGHRSASSRATARRSSSEGPVGRR